MTRLEQMAIAARDAALYSQHTDEVANWREVVRAAVEELIEIESCCRDGEPDYTAVDYLKTILTEADGKAG